MEERPLPPLGLHWPWENRNGAKSSPCDRGRAPEYAKGASLLFGLSLTLGSKGGREMEAIPQFSSDLIAKLDAQFPLRNPKPNQSHAKILYAAGQLV